MFVEAYENLMVQVIRLAPGSSPDTIVTDFELAAMNAFSRFWPNARLTGCLFHFGQSLWRNLQLTSARTGASLQQRYRDDREFALLVKKLVALAFVRPEDVVSAYEGLTDNEAYRPLESFLNYFEETYIGVARGSGPAAPRFRPQIWNQHERVRADLPRGMIQLIYP